MNRFLALVKREYWENRGAFRTTPIALFGIYIVGALMALITFNHFDNDFHTLKEAFRYAAQSEPEIREKVVFLGNISGAGLFNLVLGFVVFLVTLPLTPESTQGEVTVPVPSSMTPYGFTSYSSATSPRP